MGAWYNINIGVKHVMPLFLYTEYIFVETFVVLCHKDKGAIIIWDGFRNEDTNSRQLKTYLLYIRCREKSQWKTLRIVMVSRDSIKGTISKYWKVFFQYCQADPMFSQILHCLFLHTQYNHVVMSGFTLIHLTASFTSKRFFILMIFLFF